MTTQASERLTLHSQSHSPYARKTIVFAHEAGIVDRLAIVDQETSPTNRNPDVFAVNPLGKVPVLITPEAGAIFDSLVICDYLDGLHGGRRLIPVEGKARWQALRLHAIAQGLCDIGLATALAWLEFRDLPDFRSGRPRLTRWYETFSERASMRATAYHGETQDRPAA